MADATASQDAKMMLTITHSKGTAPDVKVAVKKVSQLKKVFAAAADRFKTTPDALVFKYNGNVLEGDHTPKMHEIPEGGIITAYPVGDDEDLATQNTNTQMSDGPGFGAKDGDAEGTQPKSNKIIIVINSSEGPSFQVKVSRQKPFKGVFEQAYQQFNKAPNTFRFTYRGNRIREEATPDSIGMDEGTDEIDADIEQIGGAFFA